MKVNEICEGKKLAIWCRKHDYIVSIYLKSNIALLLIHNNVGIFSNIFVFRKLEECGY